MTAMTKVCPTCEHNESTHCGKSITGFPDRVWCNDKGDTVDKIVLPISYTPRPSIVGVMQSGTQNYTKWSKFPE